MSTPLAPNLYFHTLKYLKPKQVLYRLVHGLKRSRSSGIARQRSADRVKEGVPLLLAPPIARFRSYDGNEFCFLNRKKKFNCLIDWRFEGFGRLWCYNLNYFDFLNQDDMDRDTGLGLIQEFIKAASQAKVCMEPYPISLRTLNWIKFLSRNRIRDQRIDACLYSQVKFLANNLEYHLLGNHLLENGIALFFAAFYFQEGRFLQKAEKILAAELDEQILPDGGHFELSAMYHQIILDRLLGCINLAQSNPSVYETIRTQRERKSLLRFIEQKAAMMLGWLREMTFASGEMPLVNDAAFGIAPDADTLRAYAGRLGIAEQNVGLNESGYRKIKRKDYEVLIDIGNIGPDYIPGHAHADTFNLLLHVENHPIIVDTGTSTYENGHLRHFQRATRAHNTVEINSCNQSEVWGGFRVARRARVFSITETAERISACHDGYQRLPGRSVHRRTWQFGENSLEIQDEITGSFQEAVARFHFHPDIRLQSFVEDAGFGTIGLPGGRQIKWQVSGGRGQWVKKAYYPEFNARKQNSCLEIFFDGPAAGVKFTW